MLHVDEPFGVALTFAYDASGHRILVVDSLGGKEESLYDYSGNLVRRVLTLDDATLRIDRTFDASGRVLTQTRYSDAAGTELVATSTYEYDAKGNLTNILHQNAEEATISEFDYAYDEASQLDSETDYQVGIDANPWTIDYGYDEQGQLTDDGENTYSYDEGGNRDNYTYVENPDEVHFTNQLASDGTWEYAYDDDGNTMSKSDNDTTWTYGYDHANHLVYARKYGIGAILELEVEFTYDAFGNRIEKAVDPDGIDSVPTEFTRYVQDGWNPEKPTPIGNENYDVRADLDGESSLTTYYLRGDRVDELDGRLDGADAYWLLADHLGSVRDVVDSVGVLKDSLVYDGFGRIQENTELDPQYRGRYAYTGREYDVEIEMQYNRARYYDPVTGRWISQDPLGFDAGDSNLYRYINNRPTTATDPSGYFLGSVFTDPFGYLHLLATEKEIKLPGYSSFAFLRSSAKDLTPFARAMDPLSVSCSGPEEFIAAVEFAHKLNKNRPVDVLLLAHGGITDGSFIIGGAEFEGGKTHGLAKLRGKVKSLTIIGCAAGKGADKKMNNPFLAKHMLLSLSKTLSGPSDEKFAPNVETSVRAYSDDMHLWWGMFTSPHVSTNPSAKLFESTNGRDVKVLDPFPPDPIPGDPRDKRLGGK